MAAPSIDARDLAVALGKRDPETLIGPMLWMLTRIARGCATEPAPSALEATLVAHLTALAAHPGVALPLRLAAGALAIEHRVCATVTRADRDCAPGR